MSSTGIPAASSPIPTQSTNPFQYAGGYFESSTGLLKFGTRYYNPALGRWTQQDPVGGSLGNSDNLNRYLYAGDDPVNFLDPSGRQSCSGTQILILAGLLVGSLALLAGAVLAIHASAVASFAALLAFASTQAGLSVILTAVGSLIVAQFSALGLSACL